MNIMLSVSNYRVLLMSCRQVKVLAHFLNQFPFSRNWGFCRRKLVVRYELKSSPTGI
jgi:hypothetical protein